jgi:large subunit ribosomal protein L2
MSTIKLYKPTTPGRRKTSVINYKEILTTDTPYKKLTTGKKINAGRNNSGKITVRHRGASGIRKVLRDITFKRSFKKGFKVLTIEYDPNRTGFISLVIDLENGEKKYILHTKDLVVGKTYNLSKDFEDGADYELKDIPVGSFVCQIELNPNQGAKIIRSAGSYAQVTAQEGRYTTLKLPSGEIRKFLSECSCVLGRIGNQSHELVRIGKAGRVRKKGFRPTVRGKVMNPVDHPHGGGEARNPIGLTSPKTPWGKIALGVKTRDKKKASGKFIIQRRNKK